MYLDFSGLFHQSSKDRMAGGRVRIPLDDKEWPNEWKEIAYKTYPRTPKIELRNDAVSADLFEAISSRSSKRDFARRPLSKEALSTLLRYGCGITREDAYGRHRAQPSGGARYPIEAYPILFVPSDIPSGVYHYNVRDHALDALWERSFTETDVEKFFTYPWAKKASLAIVLTGIFRRNQMKYGERGYRHILIEAGAIVQNIYLVAQALGISCCAIDGVHEVPLEKLLDVDGIAESAICTIVLG